MQQIILASGSSSRKVIMDSLGIDYIVIPADINEKEIRDDNPAVQAEKIARAKAEYVAQSHDGIVIAADTFGVCDGTVLEKPKTLDEAREMLKLQSNKECQTYTGFCYIDKANNIDFSETVTIKYTFRDLSEEEIDRFVKNNPVTDWSAAFNLRDSYQMGFIKKIDGSLTGITNGLPVELLIPCLQKSGVKFFTKKDFLR